MRSAIDFTYNASRTRVLSNSDTMQRIFVACDTGDLTRLGLVDRAMNAMLRSYMLGAYHVDRLLSRYFPQPENFRLLQRQTASIISGSQALHFFDRTAGPELPLDLFLFAGREREVGQYLLSVGYAFVPSDDQLTSFLEEDARAYDPDPRPLSYPKMNWGEAVAVRPLWDLPMPSNGDDGILADCGINRLYHFVKSGSQQSKDKIQIRLFVTRVSPVASILLYSHSTALLNIISYDTAYSLYPYATFIARQQVPVGLHDGELEQTLDQYLTQGWQSVTDESCQGIVEPVERWVDDQDSWIIHLKPISDHELASPGIGMYGFKTLQRFPRDPATVSGWYPLIEDLEERPIMTYSAVVGDALHYSYVTPMTKQPQLALDATRSVNEILALWGQDLPKKLGPTFADEQVINSILGDRENADDNSKPVNFDFNCIIQ